MEKDSKLYIIKLGKMLIQIYLIVLYNLLANTE